MPESTLVCRCEGVTAGQIRDLVQDGLTDHNEIKAIIRCGMGPCQGRMCGSAVHELIVEESGIAPDKARQHRLRPPIKPVSLQELANAELGDSNES
jgi:bacterioferritin-associated ferredoxin